MSTISIIGPGNMARLIGVKAVAGGNAVEVTGRDPAKAAALAGKIIVDISNNFAPDGMGLLTPEGTSAAQDIAKAAPASANVVKAFNTVFGNALAQDRPLDVLIAGDDAQAKASVSVFIESLGLRPLDAGPLAMARWLEGTGLVMTGLGRHGVGNFNFSLDVNIPA